MAVIAQPPPTQTHAEQPVQEFRSTAMPQRWPVVW